LLLHIANAGLAIIPGSHHSVFYYPDSDGTDSDAGFSLADKQALTVECNAGDLIIMPLRTVHAAHAWKPIDRDRRMMFYTFAPQDVFADEGGSVDDMLTRCGKNHHFPVGNDRYLL
jgi:ectoine hydroxylase-related dioxygenase (phytanoyl-CoA dioxygenase family)